MATKYDQALILSGGKLVTNDQVNINNSISFKRKKIESEDNNLNQDFIEINCKIIIDEINFRNFINCLEDYIPNGGSAADGEKKIDATSNLVILQTNKAADNTFSLPLQRCTLTSVFDKNSNGKITLSLESSSIVKTDHGKDPGKTDHSSIPW